MNQKRLSEALTGVVEDCVNKVGVDLNTASASLLEYISGISKVIAKNIVSHRERNGRFNSRKDLLKVDKLGPKAFEQCCWIYENSRWEKSFRWYQQFILKLMIAASNLLKKLGIKTEEISGGGLVGLGVMVKDYGETATELGIGEITLKDIVKELEKPGRDPRDEIAKTYF